MNEQEAVPQKSARDMIAEILESWPLYRSFHYSENLVHEQQHEFGVSRYFFLPQEINLLCPNPKCKKMQYWTCASEHVGAGTALHTATYGCNNCKTSWIEYFFWWTEDNKNQGLFFKAGQYPELSIEPSAKLKLDKENRDLYKKALTSRNFSYGIGAVAYLRRVVENRMNALLDLVVEAARNNGVSEDSLAEFQAVRGSSRFEDKVEFARRTLPKRLRPGGHNPFDVLHDFTSEGLHRKTEEECLEIFDGVKLTFEYLFAHLNFESEDAKRYAQELSGLAGRKHTEK